MKQVVFTFVPLLFVILALNACKEDCACDDRCSLDANSGPCLAAIPKYYYDSESGECKEFIWGGCGEYPFDTLEECQNACECD